MIDKAKIETANEIYRKAVMDLGPDLQGWSVVDLLADNTTWPLSEIHQIVPHLNDWTNLAWLGIRMICLAPNCGGEFRAAIDTDLSDPTCAVWCPFCGTDEIEESRK